MNVSLEHKLVWLAPERCATQITKKIFENYRFFSIDSKSNEKLNNFSQNSHSHSNYIFEKFKNYELIVNLRNPYDFVFSIYLNKYLRKPLLRNSQEISYNFNKWVKRSFINHGYNVFLCPFYNEPNSFLGKWTFNNEIIPNYVVRLENLEEDILKLPFITSEPEKTKEKIRNLISNNGFINKRYVSFDELYEIESAKLIYHYFKAVFHKFGYSPYSFTKEVLSNEEKISFLHGELQ